MNVAQTHTLECLKEMNTKYFLWMNDEQTHSWMQNRMNHCDIFFIDFKLWQMHFNFQSWMPSWVRMLSWNTNTSFWGLKWINHSWMQVKIWHRLPTWRASRCTSFILLTLNLIYYVKILWVLNLSLAWFTLLTTHCQIGMNMNMLNTSVCKS